VLCCEKYTPTDCFFGNFGQWVEKKEKEKHYSIVMDEDDDKNIHCLFIEKKKGNIFIIQLITMI